MKPLYASIQRASLRGDDNSFHNYRRENIARVVGVSHTGGFGLGQLVNVVCL